MPDTRSGLRNPTSPNEGSEPAEIYTYWARTEAREPYTEDVYIFPF